MAEPLLRRRHRISGRVQGVFFRASTRDMARRAGATGWVRNMPDGTVEVEAQGTADVLDQVAAFVADGPEQARVTDVTTEDLEPVEDETGFYVR